MKNLKSLSKDELDDFLNSFDLVLSDIDGVLWHFIEAIPGSELGIRSLRQIGKKVYFVSNNSSRSIGDYIMQLNNRGFDVKENQIITPIQAMSWYLRKTQFEGEIFVIGMEPIREELQREGFKLAEGEPEHTRETISDFLEAIKLKNNKINAVILDVDINLTFLKLQRAIGYLKRPETVFIAGAPDKKVPTGRHHLMLGPGYFSNIAEELSGKKAVCLAKPSKEFNEYIQATLKIVDPRRVLVIGDSISEDMRFATVGNYRKLLVFSGLSKQEDVQNWKWPNEFKPHYYIDDLKSLHLIIQQHYNL